MRRSILLALSAVVAEWLSACATATLASPPQPQTYSYREVAGKSLSAYVFAPAAHVRVEPTSAVVLFHGGGWSEGTPEWTFEAARRFADWGLVAIAIEYRLSKGTITPIESIDDACAAFRWTRDHAGDLGIDGRVAGYGVSAGGHIVAAVATGACPDANSGPDALLLWSPALDLGADAWFAKKLQGRASASDYSPVEHVSRSTPPTCIVQGAEDTLTPPSGAKRFHDRVIDAGGHCELNLHAGVGHLLTRNLANQESDFDPDPEARAEGIAQHLRFLQRLGFVRRP